MTVIMITTLLDIYSHAWRLLYTINPAVHCSISGHKTVQYNKDDAVCIQKLNLDRGRFCMFLGFVAICCISSS